MDGYMKLWGLVLLMFLIFFASIGSISKSPPTCICPTEDIWIVVKLEGKDWKVFIPKGYFNNEDNYWEDKGIKNAK